MCAHLECAPCRQLLQIHILRSSVTYPIFSAGHMHLFQKKKIRPTSTTTKCRPKPQTLRTPEQREKSSPSLHHLHSKLLLRSRDKRSLHHLYKFCNRGTFRSLIFLSLIHFIKSSVYRQTDTSPVARFEPTSRYYANQQQIQFSSAKVVSYSFIFARLSYWRESLLALALIPIGTHSICHLAFSVRSSLITLLF